MHPVVGATHEQTFRDLQNMLQKAVKLSYPKLGMAICVYSDASERFWSGIGTQNRPEQLDLPIEEEQHEPLAFVGSEFKNEELGRSTFEKECYAIFQTFEKLDYLLLGSKPAHFYTDHRTLMSVFAPLALEPTLRRHIVSKVQRWTLFLSRFPFVIEHVSGTLNVFADILTRRTRGYRRERKVMRYISSLLLQSQQIVPAADSLKWPESELFLQSQSDFNENKKRLKLDVTDELWKKNAKTWIPSQDLELQLNLIVALQSRSVGHRGFEATKRIPKEEFYWTTLDRGV